MQNTFPDAIIITLVSKLQVKIIFFLGYRKKEWVYIGEKFYRKAVWSVFWNLLYGSQHLYRKLFFNERMFDNIITRFTDARRNLKIHRV